MAFRRLALLALTALSANLAMAKDTPPEPADEPAMSANMAVKVRTSFPQSEIFGVKLVNGKATQALISVENDEPKDITVAFVGGSLWAPDPKTKGETSVIVRNLTSTRYNVKVPAGEKESINFKLQHGEMHPQELRLSLMAVLTAEGGAFYTVNAFNETISIVEPDASFFDPQLIFLYLLLLGMFVGSSYWIYTTWIATLFPQKARPGKTGERPKKGAKQVSVVDGEGSAVTTSAKAYDESWIPEHHLQRPEAKRMKSGGGGGGKSKKSSKGE